MEIISLNEARELGLKEYFTGRPCKNGHMAARYVSSRCCVVCKREQTKEWVTKHSGRFSELMKKWRTEHPDKQLEYGRSWEKKNKKKRAKRRKDPAYKKFHYEYQKEWRVKNRELDRAKHRRYYRSHRDEIRARKRVYAKENAAYYMAKAQERRARKLNATPPWADLEAIQAVHEECCRVTEATGITHHVDHVIPLQGELVCGLHIAENLQILPATENLAKRNKYEDHPQDELSSLYFSSPV